MPIKLIREDITKLAFDAIVAPTDTRFSHGGGTDAAIHHAAGEELYRACLACGELCVGGAVVTSAFNLPSKYVIHTAGPVWRGGVCGEEELLRSCYSEVLRLAKERGCESLAIPLISSGHYGFPKDKVLRIATEEIRKFISDDDMFVYIVVYDKTAYSISRSLFTDVSDFIGSALLVCEEKMPSHSYSDEPGRAMMSESASPPKPTSDGWAEYDSESFLLPTEASLKTGGLPPKPTSRARSVPFAHEELKDILKRIDRGFAETLFYYIDRKGLTDVECYKRANVDKKTFSKIKCNKNYKPSKITAVSFAIALRLNIRQTNHLLNTVGMSLSRSSKFDLIIEYFIRTGNYKDIFDVNEVLYQFDVSTLGV